MSLTIHVEAFNHPDEPDVAIQFTSDQLHHSIALDDDDAESLIADLHEAINQ